MQSKLEIRNAMHDKRSAVGDVERNKAAQSAAELLLQHLLFSSSQHIACYFARTEEFDTTPIIQAIWTANKRCYLPVLSVKNNGHLDFVKYQPNAQLHLNRYRILEPEYSETFSPAQLDLVIMPLVGFDQQGHRLGAGGGFYDKTFAFINDDSQKNPILCGLAYEFQGVHRLPVDEWDVPMNGILTEKQIRFF